MPGEERESDDPLAVEPSVGCRLRRRGELALREAVEFGDVIEDDGEVVRVVQQVLLEGRGERRQALVQRGQGRFGVVVEPCAGVGHLAVLPLHEVSLLGFEGELVELIVHGLHAPVERGIELDGVLVRRHQRGEGLFDLLDLGRRIRRRDRVEGAGHVAEELSARLESYECVLEGRHRTNAGDRVHFLLVLGECGLEGGEVVLGADDGVVGKPVGEGRR